MSQAIRREQQWEFQTAWGVTIHIPCDSIAIWHPGKGVQKPKQNRNVEAKNRESNRTVIIAINREFDSSLHHYNLNRQRPQRIHFFDLDLISFFAKGKMLFVAFLSIIPPPLHPFTPPLSNSLLTSGPCTQRTAIAWALKDDTSITRYFF